MNAEDNEKTDANYRPWSWIAGTLFAALVVWLMFELSLQVG